MGSLRVGVLLKVILLLSLVLLGLVPRKEGRQEVGVHVWVKLVF